MNIIDRIGDTAINAVTTGMTVQSVQKMMTQFGNIPNPAATISMTLKNRRIGDSIFDFNDYDIGMVPGQTFNKGAFMGFETIWVKSVWIQPYHDITIVNQNRFLRKTVIHNGTPFPQQHNFTFVKPIAFSIYVTPTVRDGIFQVRDGCKWLDSRIWSIVGVSLFLIVFISLFVVAACNGNVTVNENNSENRNESGDNDPEKKESYNKPPPHEARIDNLSRFNRMRSEIRDYVV